MPQAATLATLLAVSVSGVTDLRTGRIPNAVTYPAIAMGVLLALLRGDSTVHSSLLGLSVGFAFLFVPYVLGGMGGGDVKLMAAIGALKGYPFVLHALFYSTFLGGAAALLILIWKGEIGNTAREIRHVLYCMLVPGLRPPPLTPRGGTMPFGAAICFGTQLALALEALQLG